MNDEKTLLSRLARRLSKDSARDTPKRGKDVWDKAAIVLSAFSSIVLATVALLVNSTIQKTQTAAAEQTAKAQLAAADQAAKAQTRNENAKMTTDLMQHLLSNDPSRQQIALIALRRAVRDDDEMVVDVVSVVASTAHDDRVFDQAIAALSASKSPKVASVLSEIATARSKLQEGTKKVRIATAAAQHVAISASLPAGTIAPPLVLHQSESVPTGTTASMKVGSLDVSHFAGLREGDTPEKAIGLFGQPTRRDPAAVFFGSGGLTFFYLSLIGSPGITGITVFEAGQSFIREHAGSDPLLELIGKPQATVMSALGKPTGGTSEAIPELGGWFNPAWDLGHSGSLQVGLQSGVCQYITVNWR